MLNTEYIKYHYFGMPIEEYIFSHNGSKYIVEKSFGFYSGERFNFRIGIPFYNNSFVYKSITNEKVAKELFEMFSDKNYTEEQIELWLELNLEYKGEEITKEELLIEEAEKHYDLNDRTWFETLSDEELAVLWSECIITEYNPLGAAWDDEVHDAIYDRENRDDIFERAEEILFNRNQGEDPYYA